MKKALGYARTSTNKQEIDNQIQALKKYVQPENIYYDEAVSGIMLAKNRKAFRKINSMIEAGEVSRLYVFELSRLGRSSAETLQLFIDIELKGTQIISMSPNESWTTLVNEDMKGIRNIFVSMFAWFAEIEKKSLSERTKLGLERARKEGKQIGRPAIEPDRKEYEKLIAKGLKPAQAARVMQVPATTMIRYREKWKEEDRLKRVNGENKE
jgi:putative DNA-invertase from lambdoid prophage Rac